MRFRYPYLFATCPVDVEVTMIYADRLPLFLEREPNDDEAPFVVCIDSARYSDDEIVRMLGWTVYATPIREGTRLVGELVQGEHAITHDEMHALLAPPPSRHAH